MTLILTPRPDGVWVQVLDNGRPVVSQLASMDREERLRVALALLRSVVE